MIFLFSLEAFSKMSTTVWHMYNDEKKLFVLKVMLMALKSLETRGQNKRTVMYSLIISKKNIATLKSLWETYVIPCVSEMKTDFSDALVWG